MDKRNSSFHQDELSEEDLLVLRTFHSNEESLADTPLPLGTALGASFASQTETAPSPMLITDDEMLSLFATEVDEDIATMRSALQRMEQDEHLDSQGIEVLKRSAHKVAGTSAAIGCDSMSTIARHIESVIKLVEDSSVVDVTGSIALVRAVQALELTLQSIASNGFESKNPLLELEEEYEALNIDIHAVHTVKHSSNREVETASSEKLSQHLATLISHAERLIELDTPFGHAQQQVETALNELEAAQARLRRLEPLLTSLSVTSNITLNTTSGDIGYPPSSLVARILQEAAERAGHHPQASSNDFTQALLLHDATLWDEMEIDRFSETNVLAHSLTEAITDVAIATTHVRQALAHLNSIVAQQMSQASAVRDEVFLLESSPFSVLVTRLRLAIEMMTGAQKKRVQFESSGESIELNRDILAVLTEPLLELVQMNVAESLYFAKKSALDTEQRLRIRINAHAMGNELTIELGLSQLASAGAMISLQEASHHLYGSTTLQERSGEGMILQLRLPRSQRIIQGLLVRAGSQHVVVPISQVRRIQHQKQGMGKAHSKVEDSHERPLVNTHEVVHLNELLGFMPGNNFLEEETIRTALVLELDSPQIAVEVDAVVEVAAVLIKPLAVHLRRPGITSAAFDGNGNALLVVNLPEVIRLKGIHQNVEEIAGEANTAKRHDIPTPRPTTALRRKILVADDSVYIRQSITATLNHEGYDVKEAVDGLQTLEQLSKDAPDLLLLDIEMPNLNGYDVLNMIRTRQEFSGLKIVMLTSRSSEKHKQQAGELGAHAYLIKPCPQDLLLETIETLIQL
jgi:chemosensory pili system protein ChpA (sensor histidine kinase/response regulator)